MHLIVGVRATEQCFSVPEAPRALSTMPQMALPWLTESYQYHTVSSSKQQSQPSKIQSVSGLSHSKRAAQTKERQKAVIREKTDH